MNTIEPDWETGDGMVVICPMNLPAFAVPLDALEAVLTHDSARFTAWGSCYVFGSGRENGAATLREILKEESGIIVNGDFSSWQTNVFREYDGLFRKYWKLIA